VSQASMTEGFCRITVVTPRRRLDLAMPAHLACAELLPEVVRLSGEADQGPAPRPWVLGRLGEPPLAPERTLAEHGVYDGDLLYLRAAAQPADPVVVDDLVETIAEAVDRRGGHWNAGTWHRFALAAAAVLLGAGAVAAGVGGGRLAGAGAATGLGAGPGGAAGLGALAAGVALALLLAALGLRRLLRQPVAAAALALAALPWAALAGADLGARAVAAGSGPWAPLAAGAGGLLAAALAAAGAVPAVAGPCLAVALPAAALALGAGAVATAAATPVEAAAVLAVALLPVVGALPRLAIALAGISPGDEDAEVAVQAERAKVAVGHGLLIWLLGGAAVALAAALAVLAAAGGTMARCLAAAVAVSVALRARGFRLVGEVLPLALAALGGAVALEVAAVADRPAGPARQWAGAGLLAGTAAVLALAGLLLRRSGGSPGIRRRLDWVEALANLLLVPLALGVLGLYGAVERLAQRLGG
jgi:type VII secretion integral membrane protein EccD